MTTKFKECKAKNYKAISWCQDEKNELSIVLRQAKFQVSLTFIFKVKRFKFCYFAVQNHVRVEKEIL